MKDKMPHDLSKMYDQLINSQQYADALRATTIIGVAGKNGAGKDSLLELLRERGFLVYNTGDHLRAISQAVFRSVARGGNSAPMGQVGNAQRQRYPGGMVELGLIDWWAGAAHLPDDLRPRGLAIGSIRAVGEAARLHYFGGKLVVVDADREVRYQRLHARQRADEQGITFEEFCRNEDAELAVGETDPTKFGMAAVIEQADLTIHNNDGTIEEFEELAVRMLGEAGIEV